MAGARQRGAAAGADAPQPQPQPGAKTPQDAPPSPSPPPPPPPRPRRLFWRVARCAVRTPTPAPSDARCLALALRRRWGPLFAALAAVLLTCALSPERLPPALRTRLPPAPGWWSALRRAPPRLVSHAELAAHDGSVEGVDIWIALCGQARRGAPRIWRNSKAPTRHACTCAASSHALVLPAQVFEVTRGARHYGPGGGYAFFAGRDGTRAFVTGEFNETGAPAKQRNAHAAHACSARCSAQRARTTSPRAARARARARSRRRARRAPPAHVSAPNPARSPHDARCHPQG
jgi:hypothetical protein